MRRLSSASKTVTLDLGTPSPKKPRKALANGSLPSGSDDHGVALTQELEALVSAGAEQEHNEEDPFGHGFHMQ